MPAPYFAYGSNIERSGMLATCPGHRCLGVARLEDHRLAFTRRSVRSGAGVADVVAAPGETVWGVLYELAPADLAALDRKEGRGWAYERVSVRVSGPGDGWLVAFSYAVIEKEPLEVPPSRAYMRQVLAGAREHGLPAEYLRMLERRLPSR